jgi:hypothetical protein
MAKRDMKRDWFKNHREEHMRCHCHYRGGACGGGVYFLGFIGALIFYMQQGQGIVGILKAIVWPVFLVMKILGL